MRDSRRSRTRCYQECSLWIWAREHPYYRLACNWFVDDLHLLETIHVPQYGSNIATGVYRNWCRCIMFGKRPLRNNDVELTARNRHQAPREYTGDDQSRQSKTKIPPDTSITRKVAEFWLKHISVLYVSDIGQILGYSWFADSKTYADKITDMFHYQECLMINAEITWRSRELF